MPLGSEVALCSGHIMLDEDPAPPKWHNLPNFWPMSAVAKRLDGSGCLLVGSYPLKGVQPPTFWPMSIVAKQSPISATAELLSKQSGN